MKFDAGIWKAGDCLLYRPSSLTGYIIAIKTWTRISHVEVYAGDVPGRGKMSWASRDGLGVNLYPLRTAGLGLVRRPARWSRWQMSRAEDWFRTVRGQKYDWLGLLCFTLAVKQGAKDRMFCSEFALNLYRAAGLEVLAPECVPDHTAPAEFGQTPALRTVWTDT